MMTDKELHALHEKVTPLASQTKSRAWPWVGTSKYPRFAAHAFGTHIYDRRGVKYIDLAGANAAVPLGYCHPEVDRAVHEAAMEGPTLSLPTELEYEVSRKMVDAVPGAEMVRWVSTGSEAVQAACVTAQETVGRTRVFKLGGNYHGWHTVATQAVSASNMDDLLLRVRHAVDHQDAPAAVLWEPPRFWGVELAMLRALRELCTNTGVCLVFDDVVYGFRYATAGSQQVTGVTPDIACFSKALGNGYRVACIAGKRQWMENAGTVVSSTFGGERTGLAAAGAVLDLHRRSDVCLELHEIGVALELALVHALDGTSVDREGDFPVHFRFADREGNAPRFAKFLERCLKNGVLVHKDANNVNVHMAGLVDEIADRVGRAARGL